MGFVNGECRIENVELRIKDERWKLEALIIDVF